MKQFTQIEGQARLFAKTIKSGRGSFDAYNVTVSKKQEDGSYINAYLDCKLSNAAHATMGDADWTPTAKGESRYCDVALRGWLTVKGGDNRNYLALFINEVAPLNRELTADDDLPF